MVQLETCQQDQCFTVVFQPPQPNPVAEKKVAESMWKKGW